MLPRQQTVVLKDRAVSRLKPIDIDPDKFGPGHYTGALYLTVGESEKRTALPLEINVKDGPFWALALMLATLGVQVLLWLVARNEPRRAGIGQVHQLSDLLKGQLVKSDLELLDGRFGLARDEMVHGLVEEGSATLAGITTDARRLQAARELAQAATSGNGDLPEAVAVPLALFRDAVKSNSGEANSLLTDLRLAVEHQVDEGETIRGRVSYLVGPQALSLALRGESAEQPGLFENAKREIHYQWVQLLGHPIPWILRAVLVLVLLFAGLNEAYFKDSTFGKDWLFDYGSVVLVGFTAAAVTALVSRILPPPTKAS